MLRHWQNQQNLVEFGRYYGTSKLLQIAVDCGYITRRSYITLSGATCPSFSFSLALDPRLQTTNRIGLRVPLAVLVPRLTKSLTLTILQFSFSTKCVYYYVIGSFSIRQEKIYQHFCSIWQHIAHIAHSTYYNVQRIVSTQLRYTTAFNNTVQLITYLQPPE